MKYPNIKSAKITHDQIAQAFGFANRKSFDRTSAHKRYMAGVEKILEMGIANDKTVLRYQRSVLILFAGWVSCIGEQFFNSKKTIQEIVDEFLNGNI